EPQSTEAWTMLGAARFDMGDFKGAVAAYEKAVALAPESAPIWSALGEARVMASERDPLPAAAREAFDKAIALDAKDPRARYFMAVKKDIAGDHKGAIDDWFALLADTPQGAPWEADLRRTIEQVGAIHKIEVADRLARTQARPLTPDELPVAVRAIPGPSRAEMEAAAQLPKGQQDAMIAGMVDGPEAQPHDAGRDRQGCAGAQGRGRRQSGRGCAAQGAGRFARGAGGVGALRPRTPAPLLELDAHPCRDAAVGEALEAEQRLVVDAILVLVAAQEVDPLDPDIDVVVDVVIDAGVELAAGAIDQRQAEEEGVGRDIARSPRIAQPGVEAVFVVEERRVIRIFRQVREADQVLRAGVPELGEDGARAVRLAILARRAAGLLIGEVADEAEARGEAQHILPRRQVMLKGDFDAGLRRGAGNIEGRAARDADADTL